LSITEVPERYQFPRRRKSPPVWMRRSGGSTFRWAMAKDESDSDSDWDDTLPDLPECDL